MREGGDKRVGGDRKGVKISCPDGITPNSG